MTLERDWSYEEYRERLDAYLRKQAQRKVLKRRHMKREQIKRAGGGMALASLLLKPSRTKR